MQATTFSIGINRIQSFDARSEKNLAVAILRQAWQEAIMDLGRIKDESKDDYRHLKQQAIEWIDSDDDGFPYWCKLADVDHRAVRQQLRAALRKQRRSRR